MRDFIAGQAAGTARHVRHHGAAGAHADPLRRDILRLFVAVVEAGMVSKVVARKSGVHGKGLFAARDLEAGERLIEYKGKRYGKGYLPDMADDGITRFLRLSDGSGIDGSGWAALANHGCVPNCELVEDAGSRPKAWLFALRKVKKGEELVWDYRLDVKSKKEAYSDWACACGAKNCRGTMADMSFRGR